MFAFIRRFPDWILMGITSAVTYLVVGGVSEWPTVVATAVAFVGIAIAQWKFVPLVFPELNRFDPGYQEDGSVWRQVQRAIRSHRRYWLGLAGWLAAPFVGAGLMSGPGFVRPGPAFALAIVTAITMLFLYDWTFWRSEMRRAIRKELVLAGQPTCIVCGYDLGDMLEACPECGAAP